MKLSDSYEGKPAIYIVRCKSSNRFYVGETLNLKQRMYSHLVGKKQVFHKAIKKYGIDDFEVYVEYLSDFDKSLLLDLEEQLIEKLNSVVPNGYNVCKRGQDTTGMVMSEETRKKQSDRMKGNKLLLGHVCTEETRKKLSDATKNRDQKEYSEKMSKALKGRVFSPEHRKRLSDALKGKKFTAEHRANLRKNNYLRIQAENKRVNDATDQI